MDLEASYQGSGGGTLPGPQGNPSRISALEDTPGGGGQTLEEELEGTARGWGRSGNTY